MGSDSRHQIADHRQVGQCYGQAPSERRPQRPSLSMLAMSGWRLPGLDAKVLLSGNQSVDGVGRVLRAVVRTDRTNVCYKDPDVYPST